MNIGSCTPSRMVVISVDGLRPDICRDPNKLGLKIPTLRRLIREGASAESVESIYPTTTYPAHTTLVTGVPPRAHGIYSHLTSLDPTIGARPWHWFAGAIHVPTLWDAAWASGRKVAAISWPVSAGARIDWNIPEIWDLAVEDALRDLQTVARYSTPGIFDEAVAYLKPSSESTPDQLRREASNFLWEKYHPDLLFVHLLEYDHAAHHFGPFSPEALAVLERTDQEIGFLQEHMTQHNSVTFVVMSDHGFVPVDKEVAPLVVLIEEGLLSRDAKGSLELNRLGAIHAGGSFAFYWLEKPTADDRKGLDRAITKLVDTGAVSEVVNGEKLESLQADPDAELMLDAAPGHYFSDRFDGPAVQATLKDHGTHGQLPSRAGLEATLVVFGPGIPAGKNLGRVALTQIAPTLARLLHLPADLLGSNAPALDLA